MLTALMTILTFVAVCQVYSPPSYQPTNTFHNYGYNYNYYGNVPKTIIEKNSKLYVFTILYKDSTIETYKSKIDLYKKTYYLAIDLPEIMKSVKPSETISISRTDKTGEKFIGFSTDSCWLFKVKTAKINLYSVLAETKTRFVVAIQEGDDHPIIPISRENLEAIIPENSSARIELQRGELMKAIEIYNNRQ